MKNIIKRVETLEKDISQIKHTLRLIRDVNITCWSCGYSWHTKTKMQTISCPSCGTKNKIEGGKYEKRVA